MRFLKKLWLPISSILILLGFISLKKGNDKLKLLNIPTYGHVSENNFRSKTRPHGSLSINENTFESEQPEQNLTSEKKIPWELKKIRSGGFGHVSENNFRSKTRLRSSPAINKNSFESEQHEQNLTSEKKIPWELKKIRGGGFVGEKTSWSKKLKHTWQNLSSKSVFSSRKLFAKESKIFALNKEQKLLQMRQQQSKAVIGTSARIPITIEGNKSKVKMKHLSAEMSPIISPVVESIQLLKDAMANVAKFKEIVFRDQEKVFELTQNLINIANKSPYILKEEATKQQKKILSTCSEVVQGLEDGDSTPLLKNINLVRKVLERQSYEEAIVEAAIRNNIPEERARNEIKNYKITLSMFDIIARVSTEISINALLTEDAVEDLDALLLAGQLDQDSQRFAKISVEQGKEGFKCLSNVYQFLANHWYRVPNEKNSRSFINQHIAPTLEKYFLTEKKDKKNYDACIFKMEIEHVFPQQLSKPLRIKDQPRPTKDYIDFDKNKILLPKFLHVIKRTFDRNVYTNIIVKKKVDDKIYPKESLPESYFTTETFMDNQKKIVTINNLEENCKRKYVLNKNNKIESVNTEWLNVTHKYENPQNMIRDILARPSTLLSQHNRTQSLPNQLQSYFEDTQETKSEPIPDLTPKSKIQKVKNTRSQKNEEPLALLTSKKRGVNKNHRRTKSEPIPVSPMTLDEDSKREVNKNHENINKTIKSYPILDSQLLPNTNDSNEFFSPSSGQNSSFDSSVEVVILQSPPSVESNDDNEVSSTLLDESNEKEQNSFMTTKAVDQLKNNKNAIETAIVTSNVDLIQVENLYTMESSSSQNSICEFSQGNVTLKNNNANDEKSISDKIESINSAVDDEKK